MAIELAAARARAFSPQELLDRLDRRFAFLRAVPAQSPSVGDRDRHASLDAALEWSYRGLRPACQRLFRLLGAFSTELDLGLLERMAADSGADPAALVGDLVDQSLVVASHHPEGTRYGMLDSVRAYARLLLDQSDEHDEVRERHAELIQAAKDSAVAGLRGPGEPTAADAIDRLWPELRAAVAWSVQQRNPELLARLASGLGETAMLRECPEVGNWVDAAVGIAAADGRMIPEPHYSRALAAGAMSDWIEARFELAGSRADSAYRLWVGNGRRDDCVPILVGAILSWGVRDPASFVDLCILFAAEAAEVKNRVAESWLLSGLAMGHAYSGNASRALAVCDQAQSVARLVGSPSLLGLCQFARTALVDLDPIAAVAEADRTLATAAEGRATWLAGNTPNYRSAALFRAGGRRRPGVTRS